MVVFFQPLFYLSRTMDRMAINNEKYFAIALSHQTSEKLCKHVRPKPLFKHHKIQTSPVRNRRNHIATETLSGSGNNRCLTTTAIGATHCMIRSEPVTGATTLLLALDWMADRILEEGIPNRESRFRRAGKELKNGMEALGFYMSASPGDASPVVTDFLVPDGLNGEIVRRYYFERHDTMVGYGFYGRDEQKNYSKSFRIAHFGRSADTDRIEHVIEITRQFLKDCR